MFFAFAFLYSNSFNDKPEKCNKYVNKNLFPIQVPHNITGSTRVRRNRDAQR